VAGPALAVAALAGLAREPLDVAAVAVRPAQRLQHHLPSDGLQLTQCLV
jgi:hypothetical protein